MPAKLHAVLIADVVASRARKNLRHSLAQTLSRASQSHLREKLIALPYAVTAGDEFQTIAARLDAIPRILLELRVLFQPLSLRIGIGIGSVSDRIRPPVNQLSGEAFQFARSAIDRVKSGGSFKFETLTSFVSSNAAFNDTINLIYGLNDTLVRGVTARQWETISAVLKSGAQDRAAKNLRLDISTVSRNLKRGFYWQQIETAKAAESLILRAFR
jgi:hypothetical protein